MNTYLLTWTAATEAMELLAMGQLRTGNTPVGMGLYAATAWLFQRAMGQASEADRLAVTNGLWNAFSNVAGAGLGVVMFDERLSGTRLLGLGLGVASAILLSIKE